MEHPLHFFLALYLGGAFLAWGTILGDRTRYMPYESHWRMALLAALLGPIVVLFLAIEVTLNDSPLHFRVLPLSMRERWLRYQLEMPITAALLTRGGFVAKFGTAAERRRELRRERA